MLSRTLLISPLLCLASCASSHSRAGEPAPADGLDQTACRGERCAGIGDTLLISDSLHADQLTLSKKIDIDGTVLLPEVGFVPVAGYTSSELEKLLTEKWSPYFPKLEVHVRIEPGSGGALYFIYGEVEAAGERSFKPDTNVFEAVMAARPKETKADLAHVRVFRADSREGFLVDLARMRQTGDSSQNLALQECDIIFVPPTLAARVAISLERIRSWFREWILNPPILIAGSSAR